MVKWQPKLSGISSKYILRFAQFTPPPLNIPRLPLSKVKTVTLTSFQTESSSIKPAIKVRITLYTSIINSTTGEYSSAAFI